MTTPTLTASFPGHVSEQPARATQDCTKPSQSLQLQASNLLLIASVHVRTCVRVWGSLCCTDHVDAGVAVSGGGGGGAGMGRAEDRLGGGELRFLDPRAAAAGGQVAPPPLHNGRRRQPPLCSRSCIVLHARVAGQTLALNGRGLRVRPFTNIRRMWVGARPLFVCRFVFSNPAHQFEFFDWFGAGRIVRAPPVAGQLLLFPCWLSHRVAPFASSGGPAARSAEEEDGTRTAEVLQRRRVSVGFNLQLRRLPAEDDRSSSKG